MAITEAQVKERLSGLGGSDAPVCAGVSPYKSPLQLHYEKTGDLPPDQLESEAVEWGTRLEAVVAAAYAEKTGRTIRQQPTRTHPCLPWMRGNIDRQIVGDSRGPGILEVKTTNTFALKDWEAGPPDSVMLQVQHYLAVYGYGWGSVAVLIGGQYFRYFDIERNGELIDLLIRIEEQFWHGVQTKTPPTHEWSLRTLPLLKKLYPHDNQQTVTLPEHARLNIEGFLRAKQELEAAEERKAIYEGLLKEAMGEAAVGELPGYQLRWKNVKGSLKFQVEAFAQAHPDLYQQFLKPTVGHRRFTVHATKETHE